MKELQLPNPPAPILFAVPDPHIERWLLLDGAAFKAVFGRGCDAPDLKCRYKTRLIDEIKAANIVPSLGGIEFAEDIIRHLDIGRAARADSSFKRFVDGLNKALQSWK